MKNIIQTKIIENAEVTKDMYRLRVSANVKADPGQFVQLRLPSDEFTLRRPLGIASSADNQLKMFYRVVGHGTRFLSTLKIDDEVNLIAPLGKGFDITFDKKILLVGGGMGLAPLLFAACKFSNADVLMGGRTANEVLFWQDEFKNTTNKIFIATDDGSIGKYGFVTELLPEVLNSGSYDLVLVCGPEVMMRKTAEIAKSRNIPCQVSFEKRMACGLGACLSCSIDTLNGRKKVCKDGPIFNAEEVFF